MGLPPYFRYLPARLRPVLNPLTLTAGLVTILMGILIWEYSQEPGGAWNNAAIEDFDAPESLPDVASEAAEPDSIEALLADLDAEMARLEETGNTDSDAASALTLDSALDSSSADGQFSTDSLARYIDQYRFRSAAPLPDSGSPGAGPTAEAGQNQPAVSPPSSSRFNFGSSLDRLPGATPGTLSQAIAAQQPATAAPTPAPSVAAPAPPTQPGIVPGQLSGSNRRFIQTTPAMSPPSGTTGYVPPVSIPQPASGANSAQFSTSPSPQTLPGVTNGLGETRTPAVDSTFPASQGAPAPRPANAWDSFFNDD